MANLRVHGSYTLNERFAAEDAYDAAKKRAVGYQRVYDQVTDWRANLHGSPGGLVNLTGEDAKTAYDALFHGIRLLCIESVWLAEMRPDIMPTTEGIDYLMGLIEYDKTALEPKVQA